MYLWDAHPSRNPTPNQVYLWDASDGGIRKLLQTQGDASHVTSLAWAAHGPTIAIGTSTNLVQLWDVQTLTCVRVMEGHSSRWHGPSALSEDPAPSDSLDHPKAQAALTHPRAKPEPLGSLPWPQEPG